MIKYKIKSESSWICFRNPTEIYVVGSQGKGILETLSRINSKRQKKNRKTRPPRYCRLPNKESFGHKCLSQLYAGDFVKSKEAKNFSKQQLK